MKKVYKVMTTAALAGMLLGGAGWVTAATDVHASAAGKASAAYSAAAQKAGKAAELTQNGITLGVSEAFYDGNYIKISLKRSGKNLVGGITDSKFDEKTQDTLWEKGAIKDIRIFIDGKDIYELGGGTMSKRPTFRKIKGNTPDQAVLQMSDPSWLGGQQYTFPNKFKLTAKITLEGVDKPYTFDLSMQKSTAKPIVLKPNVSKKLGSRTVVLSQLNATSTSTRIQLIEKGFEKGKPSDFMYEFVDDQGNRLDDLSSFGTDENNKAGDMYYNCLLGPLGKNVKSITMKAFKPEYAEPGATSGAFKLDENGEIVKQEIKELEMTVKVR
ncbi:DUF5643 domain-containing protein [Paenibacillus sp. alder61]|uniref:DUF5643 domain-containing protein n=1 Tax=Paenibacillus faecis TaxID=862114 RepID=A0A5D0CYC5_9BACL|nr:MULTISPECIES: DUF5643 domain-containing protein [Paenibacillus]MCA1291519.1 DUF5643 domain-containing protein [Paenibacillus sp. alder61]TYA14700.1 hypothetical protein FRY98_03200 [Paenibacillus faecis]